jgi:glycosyltransferase involved in cell wall biosynthesis
MHWVLATVSWPSRRPERPEVDRRPLVSVITPSLNHARYIVETIHSVRSQSYDNIEHVVVDGGSTDGTIEILGGLEGPAFRWRSEPDHGMYDAINKGMAMATGEVLAYLNSDDLYPPWAVERVVAFFAAHPDVGLVYGDYIQVDAAGGQMLLLQPPYNAEYIRRSGFIPQPTAFWRRSVWETIGGFDATLQFVGDCDYWIRVGRRFRIVKVDEVLAYDRIQPGAKRSIADSSLRAEMASVRRRYRLDGDARIPPLVTEIWVALQRRLQLARFASAAALPSRRSRPWASVIVRGSVRFRPLLLALCFLPGMSVRFLPAAIRFAPLTVNSGPSIGEEDSGSDER